VSRLSGIYSTPPLRVAYRLARPDWCCVFSPVHCQPGLSPSAPAGAADNLTLQPNESAQYLQNLPTAAADHHHPAEPETLEKPLQNYCHCL